MVEEGNNRFIVIIGGLTFLFGIISQIAQQEINEATEVL